MRRNLARVQNSGLSGILCNSYGWGQVFIWQRRACVPGQPTQIRHLLNVALNQASGVAGLLATLYATLLLVIRFATGHLHGLL